MKYEVRYAEHATNDVRAIYNYIAIDLLSPMTASKLVKRIMVEIDDLSVFPNRYPLFDKEPWKKRGLHFLTIEHYSVFYTVLDDVKVVLVQAVLYNGMDISAQLDKL
jgi:toxin ParE1/3/4